MFIRGRKAIRLISSPIQASNQDEAEQAIIVLIIKDTAVDR
jgi:hypothetical protein